MTRIVNINKNEKTRLTAHSTAVRGEGNSEN